MIASTQDAEGQVSNLVQCMFGVAFCETGFRARLSGSQAECARAWRLVQPDRTPGSCLRDGSAGAAQAPTVDR